MFKELFMVILVLVTMLLITGMVWMQDQVNVLREQRNTLQTELTILKGDMRGSRSYEKR